MKKKLKKCINIIESIKLRFFRFTLLNKCEKTEEETLATIPPLIYNFFYPISL